MNDPGMYYKCVVLVRIDKKLTKKELHKLQKRHEKEKIREGQRQQREMEA